MDRGYGAGLMSFAPPEWRFLDPHLRLGILFYLHN